MIYHVINGVYRGGAERFLLALVSELEGVDHCIVSLGRSNKMQSEFNGISNHYIDCGFYKGKLEQIGAGLGRLRSFLKSDKQPVVVGWMYHGALFASIIYFLSGCRPRLIWCLRRSTNPDGYLSNWSRFSLFCLQKISKWIDVSIVCCGSKVFDSHVSLGFQASKMMVIPNGCLVPEFDGFHAREKNSNHRFGTKVDDIDNSYFRLGFAGRYDAQKGIGFLLGAYKKVVESAEKEKREVRIKLYLAGDGVLPFNPMIARELLGFSGLHNIVWLAEMQDMKNFFDCVDCYVYSSLFGEGFPNTVVEAMALEKPVIYSDVGDAKEICGDSGLLYEAGNEQSLQKAILQAYDEWCELTTWNSRRLVVAKRYGMLRSLCVTENYRNLFEGGNSPTGARNWLN